MKIIKLEQDKVKVILSDSDLLKMDIDIACLTPDSPKLSIFLCEIMDAVRAETGFSPEEGQVIVEAASKGGGIVLLLSKMEKGDSIKIRGVRALKKSESVLFELADFDALSGLLINIDYEYIINMRLYRYLNRFYAAVPRTKIPILIYEYSLKNRRSAVAESVVSEYGSLVALGGALAEIAADLKKMN